jgi:hypothetical protein
MLSSYEFSQRFTAQSILLDTCGLIVAGIRKTSAIVGRCFAVLSHILPLLLLALGLTLGIVIAAAAVALIPPTFWLGLLIVGAFGWATFPRSKAVNHA